MVAASARPAVAMIPERESASGPITAARLRRSLIGYLSLVALGAALAFTPSAFWRAFGLGLMVPGGGFLAAMTSPGAVIGFGAAVLLSVLLFGMGLVAWFGAGNILAPVLAWAGAAVLAGLAAPPVPWSGAPWLLAALIVAGAMVLHRVQTRAHAQALANRDRRNAILTERSRSVVIDTRSTVQELSERTLGLARHVLDRALQPVERYDGIDWPDQFQFGSLRYALCGMGYALAGIQYGATPAFRGYLSEAQRRLQQKMTDHRVWKYWVLENAWGNLSLDANPIHHRDNVMYHGWYMAMLGEYISNTGDDFTRRTPLALRHPSGREWHYAFSEICEVLYASHKRSPFTLFPCEPNWIYPMCNNFSAIALKIHDRLYGTSWWSEIEDDYRRHFDDEFCTADGRVVAIRSAHLGITLPMVTSAMSDCVTAHFQHGTLPDIARRSWEIARMDFIKLANEGVDIATRGWDKLDTGSYRPSMITTYAQVGAAAAEMGDDEVASLLRDRVQREFSWRDDDGVATLENVSSQAHAITLYHFAAHRNLRRNMHAVGLPAEQLRGPLLMEAPYPDVLVAYARSDGEALDLVLRPGRSRSVGASFMLSLGQLRPGAKYRCEGAADDFSADPQGWARVSVRLTGRTPIRITPST